MRVPARITTDLLRWCFDAATIQACPREEPVPLRTRVTDSTRHIMALSGSPLELPLQNYRLTTAHILYRMPDHPAILQTYVWQQYDLHPDFPQLRRFLDFWSHTLDGLLYSVTVAHAGLIKPREFKAVGKEILLH